MKPTIQRAGLAAAIVLALVVVGWPGAQAVAQPDPPVLVSPPDNYQGIGVGPRVLRLRWQEQPDAFAYEVRVKRQGEPFDDFSGLANQAQLRFGTVHEGTYEWQVRCLYGNPDAPSATAENALGPWSHKFMFSLVGDATGSSAGPMGPRMRFPEDGQGLVDGNVYRFRWEEPQGAYQYQICHETPSGTQTCHVVDDATWQFRACRWMGPWAGNEPEAGMHRLRVRAVGENGPGPWGEPIQFRLQSEGSHGDQWRDGSGYLPRPVPIAPAANATLNPTADGLVAVLSWEPLEGALYYEVKFQDSEGGAVREMDHCQYEPPASALVEEPRYALVIPEATQGSRYVWQVRAVFDEAGELTASRFSIGRPFTIGAVVEPPEAGDAVTLLAPEDGAVFSGTEAVVPFAWDAAPDGVLCQVAVFDGNGDLFAQNYVWVEQWDAAIAGYDNYTWQVRTVAVAEDGTVAGLGPVDTTWAFRVEEDVTMAGARMVGDLVFDSAVDSGDAIRALRRSADPDRIQLRLRDHSCGDSNGDGEIDSGDAVYMLRKAVAKNRD